MPEMALMAQQLVIIGNGKLIIETTVTDLVAGASGAAITVRAPRVEALAAALSAAGALVERHHDLLRVTGWDPAQVGRFAFEQRFELHELLRPRHAGERACKSIIFLARDAEMPRESGFGLSPERAKTNQPRATPWVMGEKSR